ncbi:MAG: hypothetical protein QOE29_1749 [Gaiellaceae bacterium]|jgi:uncharacterized protein YkwD|nr:hypothetical protein [Gaiellaceae bacterium]
MVGDRDERSEGSVDAARRGRLFAPALALCVVAFLWATPAPRAARGSPPAQGDAPLSLVRATLLQAINETRRAHRLRPLAIDGRLVRAARFHSRVMLETHTFAHGDFARRMARFRVAGRVMGENLAWGTGDAAAAQAIIQEWLVSPHHRENLLLPQFRRVGIGSQVGSFAGHDGATVVTVDFAGP